VKITLQLDDDLYAAYASEAGKRKVSVQALLGERLEKFREATDRALVVTEQDRRKLEALFGKAISGVPKLLEIAERWARVTIGDVHVEATPAQLEELARQAAREGKPVQKVAEERFLKVARNYFSAW
jgi:hypothetical protein